MRGPAAVALLLAFILIGGTAFINPRSEEVTMDDRISISGISKLVLRSSFFKVEIEGQSQNSVEAKITIPAGLRSRGVKVLHEQRDSELHVWVEKPIFSIPMLPGESARMNFKVPQSTDLEVENSSGSVDVAGLATENANLKVSSARLQVKDVAAKLTAKSSSGGINIESCDGEKRLDSSSGKITVIKSKGDIAAESSSGAHSYSSVDGSIAAESSSGLITIAGTKGSLDLKASSGNLAAKDVTITGDSSFSTSSGTIGVEFTNNMEDFTFKLRSSSGMIKAGTSRGKGDLEIGNGDIRIVGKSSSGNQSYQ